MFQEKEKVFGRNQRAFIGQNEDGIGLVMTGAEQPSDGVAVIQADPSDGTEFFQAIQVFLMVFSQIDGSKFPVRVSFKNSAGKLIQVDFTQGIWGIPRRFFQRIDHNTVGRGLGLLYNTIGLGQTRKLPSLFEVIRT